MKNRISGFAVIALLLVGLANPVFAKPSEEKVQARLDRLEQKAQRRVERAEVRELARAEKKEEQLQKRCERVQDKFDRATSRLNIQANRHKGVIDKVYERVQGFYESGQLTANNYDELKANVDEAQLAAEEALALLAETELELDCSEDVKPADQVALLREVFDDIKNTLKNYRKALVELISSLRAEAAEQKAEDESDPADDEKKTEDESSDNDPEDDDDQEGDREASDETQ